MRWKLLQDCAWKNPNFYLRHLIFLWIGDLCVEYAIFSPKKLTWGKTSSKLVYSMNPTVFLGCPNFFMTSGFVGRKILVELCMYHQLVHVHVVFLYNNFVNDIFRHSDKFLPLCSLSWFWMRVHWQSTSLNAEHYSRYAELREWSLHCTCTIISWITTWDISRILSI